jgi:hypothetical protein
MTMGPGAAETLRPDPFPLPPYCLGQQCWIYSLSDYFFDIYCQLADANCVQG